MQKYQSPSDIDRRFSPAQWNYVLDHAEEAYARNDTPSVYDYADKFGIEFASLWIRAQILALYGSSSNKDPGIVDGIKLFCDAFTPKVKRFKLVHLMIFFANYKAGMYDNSFASFDARRIGNAFFDKFVPDLNLILDRIEKEKQRKEREERSFTPPPGYSSLSWYQELKRRAANGDQEAVEMLNFKQ